MRVSTNGTARCPSEYRNGRLARDPDEGVRGRLVYNAKATRRALEILARNSWEMIAEHARERLAKQ
jgi:hypothetical protein